MTTNIKRDFRLVLVFAALLLGYGFCGDAEAQTTQPVYTRPSKGSVLTILNDPQASPPVTSPVYDWTAFTAVTLTSKFSKADGTACDCPTGPGTCTYTIGVQVNGSTSKTGPFFIIYSIGVGRRLQNIVAEDGSAETVVNISTPYAQFRTEATSYKDNTNTPVPTACYFNLTATPIPFTYRNIVEGTSPAGTPASKNNPPVLSGGQDYITSAAAGSGFYLNNTMRVNAQGVLAVGPGSGTPTLPTTSPVPVAASPGAATLIYTSVEAQRGVTLQNVGVWPVVCAAGTNASSVSVTRYSFVLAAGSTAGDGTGGSYVVEQLPTGTTNGRVYCVGNGGAGSVAIMPQ